LLPPRKRSAGDQADRVSGQQGAGRKRGVADRLEQAGRAAERATIAGLQQELAQARAELQEIQEIQRKITQG